MIVGTTKKKGSNEEQLRLGLEKKKDESTKSEWTRQHPNIDHFGIPGGDEEEETLNTTVC